MYCLYLLENSLELGEVCLVVLFVSLFILKDCPVLIAGNGKLNNKCNDVAQRYRFAARRVPGPF